MITSWKESACVDMTYSSRRKKTAKAQGRPVIDRMTGLALSERPAHTNPGTRGP